MKPPVSMPPLMAKPSLASMTKTVSSASSWLMRLAARVAVKRTVVARSSVNVWKSSGSRPAHTTPSTRTFG